MVEKIYNEYKWIYIINAGAALVIGTLLYHYSQYRGTLGDGLIPDSLCGAMALIFIGGLISFIIGLTSIKQYKIIGKRYESVWPKEPVPTWKEVK